MLLHKGNQAVLCVQRKDFGFTRNYDQAKEIGSNDVGVVGAIRGEANKPPFAFNLFNDVLSRT